MPSTRALSLGVIALTLALAYGVWYAYSVVLVALLHEYGWSRSVLTSNSLTIPVSEGKMMLGTWQGIYLYEHRLAGHARSVVVTVAGEA